MAGGSAGSGGEAGQAGGGGVSGNGGGPDGPVDSVLSDPAPDLARNQSPPPAADAPPAQPAADVTPDRPPPDAAEPTPPDAPADLPVPDAPLPADLAPPPPRVAQLIVGDPAALRPGDILLRAVLAAHLPGFVIQVRDDGAAVDLTNARLILIAGSVSSDAVGRKYRDVLGPVLALEYTLFDDSGNDRRRGEHRPRGSVR